MLQLWKKLWYTRVFHAIMLGQIMINLPILIFHFAAMPFIISLQIAWYWRLALVISHLLVGFYVSVRYWQRMITRWRLKAFSLVDQEHWLFLKDFAKRSYLLNEDDSAWNQLERRSTGEHEVINEIEDLVRHFENVEQSILDLQTPWRIGFKIHKWDAYIELVLRSFMSVFGLYMLFQETWILGLIIIAMVLLVGNKPIFFKLAFKDEEPLAVSESGFDLKLPVEIYIPWSDIVDLELDPHHYELFLYYYKEEKRLKVKIALGNLKISNIRSFMRLLKVYWNRYQKYESELLLAQGLRSEN